MNRHERRKYAAVEAAIQSRSNPILDAARILIGAVRAAERGQGTRSTTTELSCEVDLTGGGRETWAITVERTASAH